MTSVTRLRLGIMSHWPGTQSDLAIRCGISNPSLTHYVLGQRQMQDQHRAILAHVLKVEPEELDGWVSGPELWFWQKLAS